MPNMKKIRAVFRGKAIEVSFKEEDKFIDLNFNGHYLIQVDSKTLVPTGNGIDGRGDVLQFDAYEVEIELLY